MDRLANMSPEDQRGLAEKVKQSLYAGKITDEEAIAIKYSVLTLVSDSDCGFDYVHLVKNNPAIAKSVLSISRARVLEVLDSIIYQ